MQINPQNVLNPYVMGPGLNVSVSSGAIVLSGVPTIIPQTIVALSANTTSYIYLALSSGLITVNTSGFPASGAYPVATVVTSSTGIRSLSDSRPDVFFGTANAAGAVLLSPSGTQSITGFPLSVQGFQMAVVTETTNYVALTTDNLILADATSGNIQITIPNTAGAFYRVIKIDSSVNVVTIVSSSGTLNGAANKQLTTQWQSADIQGNYVFGGSGGTSTGGYASSTVGFSATPTFAASNVAVQHFKMTLTGDVTSSSLTGLSAGQTVVFELIQDGTGTRNFSWPSNIVNPINLSDSSAQLPNAVVIQQFLYDGTNLYPMSAGTIN